MKITKLFPVALAAFALASCSNEESVFNNDALTNAKAYLTVDFNGQNGDDVTRGTWYISSQSNNTPGFTQGDKIRVYDSELTKYDMFTYLADGNKFATSDDNINKQYAYATYPAQSFSYAGWSTDGVQAVVELPKVSGTAASYNLKKENKVSGAAAWTNIAPMWGTAEANDETNVKTTLNLLTAVLKVQLSGIAPGNCKWIKVVADKDETTKAPLTGYFDVTLASGAMLKKSSNKAFAGYYSNEIVVALPEDYEGDYIAYIPVIAGVEYKTLGIYTGTNADFTTGAELLYQYTNKTFETKFYSSNLLKSFSASASLNPNEVSLMITDKINNGMSAIYVKGAEVTVGENAIDNTIYLPNTNGKDVWLDFDAIETTTDKTLTITNKAGEEFTGTLAIKVGTAGNGSNVNINLPKAKNVVLVGDWTNDAKAITITDANKLTFGEAGMTTAITPSALTITNIRSTDADAVLVAQDATVNVALDLTTTVEADNTTNRVPLTISGTLAEGATVVNNVVVNTPADGIAIPAGKKITFNETKTLTLKQGYIGEIAVGTNNKTVTIEMPADQGTVAVKTLTTTGTKRVINFSGTPTWDGTVPANLTNIKAFTGNNIYTATQLLGIPSTAATAATTYTLANNINLNDKKWAGVAIQSGSVSNTITIDGNGKTISNLKNVEINNTNATLGVGLFSAITGTADVIIKDLTVTNATLTAPANKATQNTGILAGYTAAPVVIDNVTINGTLALGSAASSNCQQIVQNIGGMIGLATKNVTINESSIEELALTGDYNMGGLVGAFGESTTGGNTLQTNFTIAKVSSFTQNRKSATGITAGSSKPSQYGNFVGTIINGKDDTHKNTVSVQDFEADDVNAIAKSTTTYGAKKLGTKLDHDGDAETATVDYYFFGDNNSLIGYVDTASEYVAFELNGSPRTKWAAAQAQNTKNQNKTYFNVFVYAF